MAKSQVVKVSGVNPAYLAHYIEQDTSLKRLDEYIILPRFKRIQSQSSPDLISKHGIGSIVLVPGGVLVARYMKEGMPPVHIVPLFFYNEFCKWAALGDQNNKMIMEQTTDPLHPVAKKARDPNGRMEVYPDDENKRDKDKRYFRYVEHLNFICRIYDENCEQDGLEVTLTFDRGEFFTGRNFITNARMRKVKLDTESGTQMVPVPLWAQVWALKTIYREKGADKKWYGWDIDSAANPCIAEEHAEEFCARHKELAAAHEAGRVKTEYDDVDAEDPAETSAVNDEM